MDENKEKIQSFADMVDATERMSRPWQDAHKRGIIALIATNVLWAIIVAMLVWFAYMTPIDVNQQQDFTAQMQYQAYSEGVTDGE